MVVGDIATGTEVLVIGAGPGGYVAAIRAAQQGLDTTLVEKDAYGGTCLNYGCIPSKALITSADLAHQAGHAEEMGIHADPVVDMSQLRDWKDGIVDQLTGGVEKLCKANGVNLIEGTARFKDENAVRIAHGGEGQGSETIEFEHCIIATGSRVIQIPGFDFANEQVWSSRDALAAETVPDDLVVVGGGYIGMELSTTFAKLGANVTVVEMLDDILPTYESDVARVVRKRAEVLGIDMHFGEGASGWREEDDGIMVTTETEDGEENEYYADKVLVAVGRSPVTDTMEIENAGVEPDERGFIEVDDFRRTEVDHIYAIGDIVEDTPMLAHVASQEGIVAAEHIAGEPVAFDSQAVPAAVFTDPEIGTVGMTEEEAEEAGFTPAVGEMPFQASGRALTTGHTEGFVRIVADEDSGFILGAQIVGPEASELVAELALAIEMGARLEDVAATIHTHPTLAEAVMEAAENALGQAIHTLNR
ncbi:dihydrolipoyl dehydrogenase [Haloferax mediterranei ATCC 33500]|uniref:Dihydrolipoyl dehydrogenase n=1 Tax=Haloferax mediterranei (strain ATCC 33500 / DSM 1411 / JCM 8866 / NBRC 14739 / NCIMB 2177 / R-4) TaxID=523841 RepID=I3R8Q9_HALMT|nr:dihydrolipoyl dehydrogenase [Haloferax mediterranei]AFK20619.1 dihydrolipoamide dehydrogenase [Haloferax mediterranei ATCC 33500]AHZ22897.1 dihydrolipoyl dehydrogenase [Haloferax mediterranei ATCC 33500]EMA03062.1 dihydrolipoamide dehydrogenase [Haloferax mediterranei ATCC 33500]MDX5987757.1 dihydrolipoyl dehydrogenase [Haloferax mediterranei ATCC 33500]QCQ74236.1 dihydrolipoyl dehydrogenase [Haloferax mediterranei ATCC 33500]